MAWARCGECSWEVHDLPPGTGTAAWQTHHDRTHGDAETLHQLPGVEWHEQALQAIRTLAATGQPFVISQVIKLGVPDAPNPRTDWSRIQGEAEALGLIEQTGRLGHSIRPTAKGSPCAEWIGTFAARRAVA
jgi:hypothetical protein